MLVKIFREKLDFDFYKKITNFNKKFTKKINFGENVWKI